MQQEQEIYEALYKQWELQPLDVISEDEIRRQLAKRIFLLMDRSPEQFFQLMYRLDIPEQQLRMIWADPDAPEKIAALVYARQLQKLQSRRSNKKDSAEDPDLQW